MKKLMRYLILAMMIVMGTAICTQSASAKGLKTEGDYTFYYKANGSVKTGWKTIGKDTYYFRKKSQDGAPRGSMVTGFYQIDADTYYFNANGVLQTGWKTISGSNYYFQKKTGKMISGRRKKISGHYYLFDSDGRMLTGWQTYKGKRYFLKKKGALGKKGRTYSGWHSVNKKQYYFSKTGYVLTGWQEIDGSTYYFSEKGVMQTGWLTLDGNKYYLNSHGVMQTGWQEIKGKRYYFDSHGRMAKNTTVNGIAIDENGVAEISASVLIVAGHGQGDPGASSTIGGTSYQESKLTREFADLIMDQLLLEDSSVSVTMYDQNYDWYKVNYNLTMYGKVTGPQITWSDYDYILEVHFNATGAASKDLSGDGNYKGLSIFVHSSKSDTKVDKAIISSVKSGTSFKIFGGGSGIFTDSTLLNPKLAESKGVSYGLLETCFIDDKDDMTYYKKNKTKLAKAVADGILKGLGLK